MSARDDLGPVPEIPDLELEPAVSRRPAAPPPRAADATVAGAPDQLSRGRELDLEVGPGVTLGSHGAFGAAAFPALGSSSFGIDEDDDFQLIQTGSAVELADNAGPAGATASPGAPPTAWPSGRCRPSDQLPIDPLEVALVAGYGEAPKSALLSPVYAYRVLARRPALRRALAQHHQALSQLELERDAALAQLADELRPGLERHDQFRRLLDPIREIERLAAERQDALSQVDAGFQQQMAAFDQRLASVAELLGRAAAVAEERAHTHQRAESEQRRAEAKHQRIQIEMRGVLDLARQALGPAGGEVPPAQAARLAELQARAKALEPELLQARAAKAAAEASLQRAEGELRRLQADQRKLQGQKRSAAGSLEKQLAQRAAGVSDAEKQRRDALAEVARAVLATRGALAVPEPTLDALLAHDARVEAQAIRLETHVRALDCQDHERVKQGVQIALGCLGLVVLAIALKAVL